MDFSFLIVIQSINSYANVSFDLRIEKCTKDEVVAKHVLHAENEKSLHVYDLAMPWSFGDFGVNYNIFYKEDDAYTKIRQDYLTSNSVNVLNLGGRKISKSVEISRFFGVMRDVLELQDLYVY